MHRHGQLTAVLPIGAGVLGLVGSPPRPLRSPSHEEQALARPRMERLQAAVARNEDALAEHGRRHESTDR